MNRMLLLPPVLAMVTLVAGCRARGGLVPDYDVLAVPASPELYEPGRRWDPELGVPTQPAGEGVEVQRTAGLDELEARRLGSFGAELTVPVLAWLGGGLGLSREEVTTLELAGLEHAVVRDARAVRATGAVLWETIAAREVLLEVEAEAAARLALTAEAIERGLEEPAALSVDRRGERSYRIRAERPLVVAVRVVRIERDVERARVRIDLTTAAVAEGRLVEGPFGYVVQPREPFDPDLRRVRLRIRNADVPGWPGTTHDFSRTDDTWINDEREVIAAADRRARAADYVWDQLYLEWNPDRASSTLHVDRQYLTLHPH